MHHRSSNGVGGGDPAEASGWASWRCRQARIECLVGAQRVQQAAERLLLCSKVWPPPPPPGAASAASPVRSEPGERARRELANLAILAGQAQQRLGAAGAVAAASTAEDDEALADCGRRLQIACVQCIEAVYRAVYTGLQQQQQPPLGEPGGGGGDPGGQGQQLNRLAVGRACDGLLSAAHGLELAVAAAVGGVGRPAGLDGQLGRLSEQLSLSLADLSRAGRPARLGGDPADAEALQLSVRCAAAAAAQLLHAVRCVRAMVAGVGSGAHWDEATMEDLRSRVRLAAEGLWPTVAGVLAVAGEVRFSGRPLRLSEEAKAGKGRALGHALPVALATVELLTAMGGAMEQQRQQPRLPMLAEALQAACRDCLAKIQPIGAG